MTINNLEINFIMLEVYFWKHLANNLKNNKFFLDSLIAYRDSLTQNKISC